MDWRPLEHFDELWSILVTSGMHAMMVPVELIGGPHDGRVLFVNESVKHVLVEAREQDGRAGAIDRYERGWKGRSSWAIYMLPDGRPVLRDGSVS